MISSSSVSVISASSDSSPSGNSPEKETSSAESTVADPNAETKKELAANSDMEYSESYYENHTGVEMNQEELEAKVNELWNYDYKPLQGDADYEGLITVLK